MLSKSCHTWHARSGQGELERGGDKGSFINCVTRDKGGGEVSGRDQRRGRRRGGNGGKGELEGRGGEGGQRAGQSRSGHELDTEDHRRSFGVSLTRYRSICT